MKAAVLVPPLLALALSAWWIGGREVVVTQLESYSEILRKRIAEVRNDGHAEVDRQHEGGKPAWTKLSAQALRANQTSVGFGKLRARLAKLSTDELLAGLEKMSASTSFGDDVLKELLIEALIKKDPKLALDRMIGEGDDSGRNVIDYLLAQLGSAMREFATKDPAGAGSWFDQAVADGVFKVKRLDGLNTAREELEGALVTSLLSNDPNAAAERLKAMPEESRADKLHDHANSPIRKENQAAFATIARELSPKSATSLIVTQATQLAGEEGLAAVSEFLTRIEATDGERAGAAERAAARQISAQAKLAAIKPDDIDVMRRWVATEAPGSEDRATGSALSKLASEDFATAAELVMKYHEQSDGDGIVRSFLDEFSESDEARHRDEIHAVVEKIRDEALRNAYLKELE